MLILIIFIFIPTILFVIDSIIIISIINIITINFFFFF